MEKDKRSDSQLIEDIRKLMSDTNRSAFFHLTEIVEGIGYSREKHLILSPYNRLENLIGQMQCTHLLTTGGSVAPDKYVLKERMDQYLKGQVGQVL